MSLSLVLHSGNRERSRGKSCWFLRLWVDFFFLNRIISVIQPVITSWQCAAGSHLSFGESRRTGKYREELLVFARQLNFWKPHESQKNPNLKRLQVDETALVFYPAREWVMALFTWGVSSASAYIYSAYIYSAMLCIYALYTWALWTSTALMYIALIYIVSYSAYIYTIYISAHIYSAMLCMYMPYIYKRYKPH